MKFLSIQSTWAARISQSQWQRERRHAARQGVVERRMRSSERSASIVMRQ